MDLLIQAANQADATAKSYRTISNSSEFRDAVNKTNQANEQMVTSTQKVTNAQKEQAKTQQTIITLARETNTSWRSVIGTLQENIKQNERYKTELKQVQAEIKQQIKAGTDVNGVLRNVSKELIELRQREAELKQGISENTITIRQQTKEINAAEGSMKQTAVTLGLMKQAYRDLTDEEKRSNFGQMLHSQIQEIDSSLKDADASIGNFFREVGNYRGKFAEAFEQVLSGNTKDAIDTLDTSFKSLVASARAFIASPIGIAVAALAGIGLAAKAIWDYNQGLRENLVLVEQFTGATGQSADAIRQQAQALTDTFGGDFKENLNAADKLVKAFGLTYEEAFDKIAMGLANGGVANKEFLESINEYPQLFKNAGYSADEFINLINTGFSQGLFSDKLVDGIKEADLALKEQTKTTRDALVNAFGEVWSDELLRRIKTGETTTKQALIEIAQQAQETGLNQQQLAQITADLFKGAGEDAGGAAKFFDILNESVGNLGEPLTETSKYFMDLKDANVELQVAMDSALKSDSVISFAQQWEIAWVKIQTQFFNFLAGARDVFTWIDKIVGIGDHLIARWNAVTAVTAKLREVFDFLSTTFNRIAERFGFTNEEASSFGRIIADLFNPLRKFEQMLTAAVAIIEFLADAFMESITYAEAFGRTIGQLLSLDFDKMKDLGQNAQDIRNENAEYEKRIKLEKDRNTLLKDFTTLNEKLGNQAKSIVESEKEAERERKKAAEEAAKENEKRQKENEKRQKEYAAAEKKAADERKKQLEDQAREEIAMSAALLENFKLTQNKKLDFNESFTMQAVEDYKAYLGQVFAMEKTHAEKVAGISYENAVGIDVSKRTSDQQKLINYVIGLEQQKAEAIKKIDDDVQAHNEKKAGENFELEKKRLALDYAYTLLTAEDKKKAEQDYHDKVNELALSNFELKTGLSADEVEAKYNSNAILTEQEMAFLDTIFEIRKADKERNDELKKQETEENNKRLESSLETLGEYLGVEQQMREAFEAYKKLQKAQDIGDTEEAEKAKLEIIASVASAAASVLGEYTAFGKAAAMVSAGINTALAIINALTVQPPWLGIALSVAIGAMGAIQIAKIAAQQPPQAPKFSASFADGVLNSTFEGKALVDEEGPELHYDRYGKLKFAGKNKPNIRDVKKGDTILPAPISQKIKEISQYNPIPDLLQKMDFKYFENDSYKFDKLENKVDQVKRAINKKANFVWDGKNLIEITGTDGSSHQRVIPKFDDKPKITQHTIE